MKNSFYTNTKLVGLIGHPIKHSYSPFINNIAFQIKELDYIYLPFDVVADNLQSALKGIVSLGITGFNVTIPHKEKIIGYLDELSEEAAMIGAINTVVNDQDKLKGYNTDVNGIIETLNPYKNKIAGKCVSVLGAGGAARALIFTLIRHFKPEEIVIINRTEQRGDTLANYFSEKMKFENFKVRELFPPDLVDVFNNSKLIVNASAIGMYPEVDDSPTDIKESFTKGQIVFDMVYNPKETKLLKVASEAGATALSGLTMLVYQAAKAFELWTGEKLPVQKVTHSLEFILSK